MKRTKRTLAIVPRRTLVVVLIFAEWCQNRGERLVRDLDTHVQPSRG